MSEDIMHRRIGGPHDLGCTCDRCVDDSRRRNAAIEAAVKLVRSQMGTATHVGIRGRIYAVRTEE